VINEWVHGAILQLCLELNQKVDVVSCVSRTLTFSFQDCKNCQSLNKKNDGLIKSNYPQLRCHSSDCTHVTHRSNIG
jgi:hypothetical protein